MKERVRTVTLVLTALASLVLVGIWATNGYEHTWFYVTLLLLVISVSWTQIVRKDTRR